MTAVASAPPSSSTSPPLTYARATGGRRKAYGRRVALDGLEGGGGPGFAPLDAVVALGLTVLYGLLALLVATVFVERAEITG